MNPSLEYILHIVVYNVFKINCKLYGKTSLISKNSHTKLCLKINLPDHIPLYTHNKNYFFWIQPVKWYQQVWRLIHRGYSLLLQKSNFCLKIQYLLHRDSLVCNIFNRNAASDGHNFPSTANLWTTLSPFLLVNVAGWL